ncbi:PREDICTED: wolframin-like isoform X3 [Cyprinodon variegatus]|uniref:wolframin-like isoform X3 n=1 Tax=Cyprinodon variegatus TaxID=28743 RepID=UPI0007429787|nr:PREDICTED: wolframin-like isoform X3 [Cyprinodon variegatus]
MEKDTPSAPSVSVTDSCPVLRGPPPSAPRQIPSTPMPNNPTAPPHPYQLPSQSNPGNISDSSSSPIQPVILEKSKPVPFTPSVSKPFTAEGAEKPQLASSNMSSSLEFGSASPPSSSSGSNTMTESITSPSGAASTKRSFASVAKRVIMQERLRRAEEEDADEDEDEEEPEVELSLEQMEEKANTGDARAQTQLGQHFLILAEEKDPDLNNHLAVNWLIKAAKQGRKSAARLLQRCWIQKKGITPENEADVRKLSKEGKFELAVRKAAMMMYWRLNPDRKKKVAVSELLQNVSQVNSVQGGTASRMPAPTSGQTQKVLESMVSNDSKQLVDLDDFVEMTKMYAEGIVPSTPKNGSQSTLKTRRYSQSVSEGKDKSEVLPKEHKKARKHSWSFGYSGMMPDADQANAMKSHLMTLQYPLHAVIEMKEHLFDWASKAGVQWLSTLIPTQHVNALIFFFFISNLTVDLFAFVIPLLVFYLSFVSMIICTLRIFQSSKTWENFRALTTLLTRFEPGLDVEQAETNFGWNNLEQYVYFIISVFFVIFSFPVADKKWIPCSELSTVAIFFTALSYYSLSPAAAAYARQAMCIEVASNLCCLTQLLPENMTTLRFCGHTFATIPLGESVVLKLSIPCLLYVYLFYLFFSMARTRGFRGTYCFLIPYLVCFMWCEFSVVLLQNSSAVGLIRTCVAYFLFLFALPALVFGLATMLFIQIFKWFIELELTKVIVTLVICAIPVTLRLWTRFSTSILNVFRSLMHWGPVKFILLCISMVILLFSVYVYHAEGQKVYNSTLTWNQYSQICGPPAWESKGMAQTQIFCSHLQGHRVTWTGRFRHTRIAETENGAQSVINILPVFIGDWMRCLYGETYPKCEPKNTTLANNSVAEKTNSSSSASVSLATLLQMQEEEELCQVKALAKHSCHVKRFDSYRFEVTVGIIDDGSSGLGDPAKDIILMASNEFKQVLLNLRPGNIVEFSTKLDGRLGAKAPAFELKAIHCLDCPSSRLTGGRQVKIERDFRRTTIKALKFAFDFFFSPFLSAKIHT